jgi:outer membrane protein assembly factor BamD (BamD/ComL family)
MNTQKIQFLKDNIQKRSIDVGLNVTYSLITIGVKKKSEYEAVYYDDNTWEFNVCVQINGSNKIKIQRITAMKYKKYETKFINSFKWMQLLLCVSVLFSAQVIAEGRKSSLNVNLRAKQLYDKAVELMEYKEYERGISMLETVIRDNQGNILGYRSHMVIGKHWLSKNKTKEAQSHFNLLTRILKPKPGEKKRNEELVTLYRESLFQSGICAYRGGKYTAAFPMFRQLAKVAAKTEWANKAYYYIGMSHYQLKSWNKAIEALSLVGTEKADSEKGDMGRIEIGQRFYARIIDEDVPVLNRLKKEVKVKVEVSSGDVENLTAVPVAGRRNQMVVSGETVVGKPKIGDRIIQMLGGDTLKVTYLDGTTLEGDKNVARTGIVKAVSTGVVGFYKGDYATPSPIAYPGEPQHIMLQDADLDTSNKAETVNIIVVSRYKKAKKEVDENSEEEDALELFAGMEEEKETWVERDSIEIKLVEVDKNPAQGGIRGGTFRAKFKLGKVEDGVTEGDEILTCNELDQLKVRYTDSLHIYGPDPRESVVSLPVSGSINSDPRVVIYKVSDLILKFKKNQVEADAEIGLGKIYDEMGLEKRAEQNANTALKKVNNNLASSGKVAESKLIEESFRAKWEAEFLKKDFEAATETCKAFNNLYPESVLADKALMALSHTLLERGDYEAAVASYESVLELKNPISAAEAQFRIGEVQEKQARAASKDAANSNWTSDGQKKSMLNNAMGKAVGAYRATFENYPESPFAAEALGKVVRYYVDVGNVSAASDLLDRVFTDFPDAPFLDEMLMLWSQVAMQTNETAVAIQKLRQLTFDYPSSRFINEAKSKLSALEKSSTEDDE